MICLFLDTSSSYLNIAIVKNKELLKEEYIYLEKDMSRLALLKIKEMMDSICLMPNDIDKILIVNGPGSYTGLRVGVTIAKTYSWGLNKLLVSVSSLYCMATSITDSDYIIPVIDARREYLFASIYDKNYNEILKEQYISKEDLLKELNKLEGSKTFVATDNVYDLDVVKYKPNIKNMIDNLKENYVNPHELVPNYLKKTEAEETLEK